MNDEEISKLQIDLKTIEAKLDAEQYTNSVYYNTIKEFVEKNSELNKENKQLKEHILDLENKLCNNDDSIKILSDKTIVICGLKKGEVVKLPKKCSAYDRMDKFTEWKAYEEYLLSNGKIDYKPIEYDIKNNKLCIKNNNTKLTLLEVHKTRKKPTKNSKTIKNFKIIIK